MSETRDDVPFEDFEEQQREFDPLPTEEGEDLPDSALDPLSLEADEADALEQLITVPETDDYPPETTAG
jgi:hypothetical protein